MPEEDRQNFLHKVQAFLQGHRRVVEDFARSLGNARHFLELAHRSVDQEPENTILMLEQIKEIDLYGHLSRQFEEYQSTAGFLEPPDSPLDEPGVTAELADLRERYEALLLEAEQQMEALDELLFSLQNQQ